MKSILFFIIILSIQSKSQSSKMRKIFFDLIQKECDIQKEEEISIGGVNIEKTQKPTQQSEFLIYSSIREDKFDFSLPFSIYSLRTSKKKRNTHYKYFYNIITRRDKFSDLKFHFLGFDKCIVHKYRIFGIDFSRYSKMYLKIKETSEDFYKPYRREVLEEFKLENKLFLFTNIVRLFNKLYKRNLRMFRIATKDIKYDKNLQVFLPSYKLGSFTDINEDPSLIYKNEDPSKPENAAVPTIEHLWIDFSKEEYPYLTPGILSNSELTLEKAEESDRYNLLMIFFEIMGLDLEIFFMGKRKNCITDDYCRISAGESLVKIVNKYNQYDKNILKSLFSYFIQTILDKSVPTLDMFKKLNMVNFAQHYVSKEYLCNKKYAKELLFMFVKDIDVISIQRISFEFRLINPSTPRVLEQIDYFVDVNERIIKSQEETYLTSEDDGDNDNYDDNDNDDDVSNPMSGHIWETFLSIDLPMDPTSINGISSVIKRLNAIDQLKSNDKKLKSYVEYNQISDYIPTISGCTFNNKYIGFSIPSITLQLSYVHSSKFGLSMNIEFTKKDKINALLSVIKLQNDLIKSLQSFKKNVGKVFFVLQEEDILIDSNLENVQKSFQVYLEPKSMQRIIDGLDSQGLEKQICDKDFEQIPNSLPPETRLFCSGKDEKSKYSFLTPNFFSWNICNLIHKMFIPNPVRGKSFSYSLKSIDKDLKSEFRSSDQFVLELSKLLTSCYDLNAKNRASLTTIESTLKKISALSKGRI